MAKNKIETNKEELFDGNEENDIINNISKQNFMNWLEENGFSEKQLKQFFQEKRISSIEQNRFNIILRKAKKEIGVSISEIVIYLENSVFRLKKILSVLDEDTFHILKHELASKFKIKIDKNMLYKILE
jgi:hypothetical protein